LSEFQGDRQGQSAADDGETLPAPIVKSSGGAVLYLDEPNEIGVERSIIVEFSEPVTETARPLIDTCHDQVNMSG